MMISTISNNLRFLPALMLFFFAMLPAEAQDNDSKRAEVHFDEGIAISKDSSFLMNLKFRMQSRAGFSTISGDNLGVDEFEMMVRRLRLRLGGHILSPKLEYDVQLSFSKSDLDLDEQDKAQIIRDAILYYHFNDKFYMGFGQTKLPGNRQRVNSSGELQFYERSVVNSTFTLDRDFGFFGYYTHQIANSLLLLKGAVTTGDGRNALPSNNGLAYTGRVEFLPFGSFTNEGDYSEGDLEFEENPKLALGAAFSKNFNATKSGGQYGEDLYGTRDLSSIIVDAIFKYRGWAASSEFIKRDADDPITRNLQGDIRHIFTGHGLNTQLSKMLSQKTELAFRYAFVDPEEEIASVQERSDEALVGLTRYINGHKIKVQGNLGYNWVDGEAHTSHRANHWIAMFQVEFGI